MLHPFVSLQSYELLNPLKALIVYTKNANEDQFQDQQQKFSVSFHRTQKAERRIRTVASTPQDFVTKSPRQKIRFFKVFIPVKLAPVAAFIEKVKLRIFPRERCIVVNCLLFVGPK
ncbi:hypothetical protein ACES2I_02015 [Bdellovibrio bacteriovorus]|uniref:hypothetical protein n=1 Tax=Bdellovibrio bacteriovorus TaxID=959 RepID=UPI0035A7093F